MAVLLRKLPRGGQAEMASVFCPSLLLPRNRDTVSVKLVAPLTKTLKDITLELAAACDAQEEPVTLHFCLWLLNMGEKEQSRLDCLRFCPLR